MKQPLTLPIDPNAPLGIGFEDLFAAFVAWNKSHDNFLCTNHLEVFSDGSGRVANTRGHWPIEFSNLQDGIEKLKAANVPDERHAE